MWPPSSLAYLPHRRGELSQMSILDRKGVSVRKAGAEKRALLADRCALRSSMWAAAQVWLPFLPEGLPSPGGLRRRNQPLQPALWKEQDDVWPSLYRTMPRAVRLSRENTMFVQGRSDMWLWTTSTRKTVQRRQGCDLQGPGAVAPTPARADPIDMRRRMHTSGAEPLSGGCSWHRHQPDNNASNHHSREPPLLGRDSEPIRPARKLGTSINPPNLRSQPPLPGGGRETNPLIPLPAGEIHPPCICALPCRRLGLRDRKS